MEIEVKEFYEEHRDDSKGKLRGSLHVSIPELQIDLRGIIVSKRKDSWFIGVPSRIGIDAETGKPVRYPVLSFKDRAKNEALKSAIRQKGQAFIEGKLLEECEKK